MRDEENRRPRAASPFVEKAGDRVLVGEIEREQRLVGEHERGIRDERLGDPQALLLAAREPADRSVRVGTCADAGERSVDACPSRSVEPADAPAMAVEPQPDEVAPA